MGLVIFRLSKGILPFRDGLSAHVHFLSWYQVRAGHEVVAVQPLHHARPRSGLELRKVDIGVDPRRLGEKLLAARFSLRSIGELRRLAKQRRVDLVHAHGDVIEAAILGNFARSVLGLPFVLTMHGGLNNRKLYERVARWIFPRVSGFIVVSEGIRDELLALGVPPAKIAVISSGIEYPRFARSRGPCRRKLRQRLGIPARDCLVVFVGRLHKMKGLDVLARAARLVRGERRIRFLLVGDGPERDELGRTVQSLPNVTMYGAASREEVQDILRAADVFVLPSIDLARQTEGTPTAVMEAMASGLAVVASRIGGTPRLIEHGESGLLVAQNSPEELAAAIRTLAANRRLRGRLGRNASRAVRAKDWSRIASLVVEAYRGFDRHPVAPR